MATITIRNLKDEVRDALRVQAARNGQSLEAEVREILERSVTIRKKVDVETVIQRIQERLRSANGGKLPTGVVDELIAERRAEAAREFDPPSKAAE
jgi:plasmid stability protein